MVNMNMIVNTSDLVGYEAETQNIKANKNTALAKLLKAWESKQAKKAKTVGGFGLLAVSLAACNTSTDDTTTTSSSSTTTTTTTATPKTMLLTSGIDVGESYTGGTGNDTFIADNTPALDQSSTADSLDGGDGTDTLKIYSDGAAPALPTLASVEVLTVYDQDANITLNAVDQGSVTTANFERGDGIVTYTMPVNVTTVGLTNITLSGDGGGGADTTIAAAATATAMTINLDRISTAAGNTDEDIDVTGAKIATVTINTSGTKSAVDNMDLAGAATININAGVGFTVGGITTTSTTGAMTITGAGAVSIGQIDNGVDSISAGTASGAITMTAPANNEDFVATLGSGNDIVTTDDDGFSAATKKFNIDAGAGTDILVLGAAADADTAAEAARYDNFETIRTATTQDMSLVAGITGLQITGGTSQTYSAMSATQLGNVTFQGNNATSTIFTGSAVTGTSDSLVINLSSATATTNVDVVGISAIGIENVTINATTGTDATMSDFGFLANSADSVSSITVTGSADVQINQVAATFDVVAVSINASGMTGTGHLVIGGGVFVTGSSVTGTANGDTIAVSSTTGTTYTSGAGNDSFTGSVADLVATGANDNSINGGDGTDSLTLDDVTTTLTDNHFTNLSNMETLALSNTTGDLSITTGSAFNSAFANGVTITSGAMAATKDVTFSGGLATVDVTLTVDGDNIVGAATDVNAITTGSGNDTITFDADGAFVGVNGGAGGSITVDSGSGNDTITVKVGTLNTTNTDAVTITAGTGQDTINKTGTNTADAEGVFKFVMTAGHSTTTAHDTITGFDVSNGTRFSDNIDFSGTAVVGTNATHTDFGTILSSSVATGVASFDDAAAYNAAIVINSSNLADAVGFLNLNTQALGAIAFAYDNNNDGTAESTMVFHQNGTGAASDSLVLLKDITGVDAVLVTEAAGTANDIIVL